MTAIYLGNNATTRVDPAVLRAMLPYFAEHYGNPSSSHQFGERAKHALQETRQQVQALLGAAHPGEIVFTSGGTEANVTAILSALKSRPGRREIVTTAVEHAVVLATCRALEHDGYRVHYLQVDRRGRLNLDECQRVLNERTALVSVMWANNETGVLFPVARLADLAYAVGTLFHTDAVQAVGKTPIDLQAVRADMLSLSGHKLHAPKGIGVLYLRWKTPFQPLLRGGRQEGERRAGTENTPAIVGLGKAAELALAQLDYESTAVGTLRDRLQEGILAAVPDACVIGDSNSRLPNTLNIAFPATDSEHLVLLLDQESVAVSNGSACTAGSAEPSHVLLAMGLPAATVRGAVRFSLSRYTTLDEVDRVSRILPPLVERLRRLAPRAAAVERASG